MSNGQWRMAPNGRYGPAFQADGNLVAYCPNDRPLWHAGTFGNPDARFTLQPEGKVLTYAADGRVLWHSLTWASGGSTLRSQSDGNMVIYRGKGVQPGTQAGTPGELALARVG
ncbi:hypothetical protein FHN55_09140 [Streptomyces sp. NP160]|uniref:hypothetical protein n=1 Tax=Streptomyces sp. NP160 TaxID=2586637 RepID=UPI00111954FC|nr:hypothetical protein [Streptomyces sp. NP160]TNM67607.1 hypothetical protein FHN55_09140 [Streptomyces sp. NP160]